MRKGSALSKCIRGGVLALTFVLCIFAISVSAQNSNTGVAATPPVQTVRDDDDRDWGWLGLIGLLGLAGLLGRRSTPERYPDRDRERERERKP